MHAASDLLCFLLKNVLGYRKKVIDSNLRYCFPLYSKQEIIALRNKYYSHLCDILFESLKGLSVDSASLVPRFKLINPEILNAEFSKGTPVTIYSQHYNNWEWATISLGIQMQHKLIATIKPLSNPYISQFINARRKGENAEILATEKVGEFYRRNDLSGTALAFVADQYPHLKKRSIDISFFGHTVPFHNGAAILACRAGYPVYSVDIRKVGRSRYEITNQLIHADPSSIRPEELTRLYIKHLENLILEAPEFWLWSHKRFKHSLNYS